MATKTGERLVSLPVINDPTCAPLVDVIRPDASLMARCKAIADETRVMLLLTLLHAGGSICVCNLLPGAGVGQATVSHHLKVLREAGLVEVERRGIWAHYAIAPAMRPWLVSLFAH